MAITDSLTARWAGKDHPFLITENGSLGVDQILSQDVSRLDEIKAGDVVALVGDFDVLSIAELITLIDRNAILVPLTEQTREQHPYFQDSALADWYIDGRSVQKRSHRDRNPLIGELRRRGHPGLVLFSTGTTGRPKAILHDMTDFLKRFETPRPALRTMSFLLFDHIGGINTLLHTMFNCGVVVKPSERSISGVLDSCRRHNVEVLPTTPTFLRMMIMSGLATENFPECVKIITYGTERMDQPTLDLLCSLLPQVDFRQTFGMSELGILRVKSKSPNSLFMKVGGEGVRTRVESGELKILSPTRMMGYLNAQSPFDEDGWYNTRDVVEVDGDYIRIIGRTSEVINVGGLKFMASEVERVALECPGVSLVSITPRDNPITGQHVEMTVQPVSDKTVDLTELKKFLELRLPAHMLPRRITIARVPIGHRFKKS